MGNGGNEKVVANESLGTLGISIQANYTSIKNAIKQVDKLSAASVKCNANFHTFTNYINNIKDAKITNLNVKLQRTQNLLKKMKKSPLKNTTKEAGALNGVIRTLTKRLTAMYILWKAWQTLKLADEFTGIRKRVLALSSSIQEFNVVFGGMSDIALSTGVHLNTVARLFRTLQRTQIHVTKTNETMNESYLRISEGIGKIVAISGALPQNIQNGLLQLSQGLSAGILRAEEYNSLIENLPELTSRIAAGLGLSVNELRQMVLQGRILSEDIMGSLSRQTENFNRLFNTMGLGLSSGLSAMKTSIGLVLSDLDKVFNITRGMGSEFKRLAKIINGIRPEISGVASAIGKIFNSPINLPFWVLKGGMFNKREQTPTDKPETIDQVKKQRESLKARQSIMNREQQFTEAQLLQRIEIIRKSNLTEIELEKEKNKQKLEIFKQYYVKIMTKEQALQKEVEQLRQKDSLTVVDKERISVMSEQIKLLADKKKKAHDVEVRNEKDKGLKAILIGAMEYKQKKKYGEMTNKDKGAFIREQLEMHKNSSRTMFEINRKVALTSVAISSSQAVMEAYTTGMKTGIGTAIANAALAAAFGLTQIATIQNQTYGGKASGGYVKSNSLYNVNERGTEMLSVGGNDFLMTGSQGGYVTPHNRIAGRSGQQPHVTINITNNTNGDVETSSSFSEQGTVIDIIVEQVKNDISSGIERGDSRFSKSLESTYGLRR